MGSIGLSGRYWFDHGFIKIGYLHESVDVNQDGCHCRWKGDRRIIGADFALIHLTQRMFRHTIWALIFPFLLSPIEVEGQSDFRIPPYLQDLDFTGVSIVWFTNSGEPGSVVVSDELGFRSKESSPVQVTALNYPIWEIATNPEDFPGGVAPPPPYRHRVRFDDLEWQKSYNYAVTQGGETFASTFRTPPGILKSVRFAVYGDSETEPESDGAHVAWPDPDGLTPNRTYLLDQTQGYANNLEIMRQRDLDFVAVVGDLVQSGGEQRDWDRFWKHNTSLSPDSSLGGQIPIYAVPGNHEYYATPHRAQSEPEAKEYRQPFSEDAMAKYRAYFEAPSNGTGDAREGRYYRFDYGPVAMIAIDVCNNGLNQLSQDTNFQLLGEDDANGGAAPSFSPGTDQYRWLEDQLADAQQVSPFTFVLMHYTPYSVGPHGLSPGVGEGQDPLSGVPVQALTPLFQQYGVDAVFAGHDEMWERSVVDGTEHRPDETNRPNQIQFYDVGVGGDGLRGSIDGLENPFQAFFVHTDAPEIWDGPRLIDGGKHYGHLEVDVERTGPSQWAATLTPVYAFPLFDETGTEYLGYERRIYDDVVTLVTNDTPTILDGESEAPDRIQTYVSETYPNPAVAGTSLTLALEKSSNVAITVFDVTGRAIRHIATETMQPGTHAVRWDGLTESGDAAPSGTYLIQVRHAAGVENRTVSVVR